ncbi:MAG: chloride channel core, partial [Bacteroidetes bacterium]
MNRRSRFNFIRRLRIYQWFWGRNWRRAFTVREHVRVNEETFHILLAVLVGVIGGIVNVGFLYGVEGLKLLALHQPGDLVSIAQLLPWWQRLIIPAIGGLAAGLVLHWGAGLITRGTSNFMEAVVAGDGRLSLGSGCVRAASSLISVPTGASIGREGAIAALTSTIASKLGQMAAWPPYRLRLLVGCGVSAGIAAAYNAPVAGALFAAHIVLGNFSMQIFAPLVTASVVGTLVSRTFFGVQPWYRVEPFEFEHLPQLFWFCFLGIFVGMAGAMFLRMLEAGKTLFGRLKAPIYLRLALGGLIVGIIAVEWPEVWGNGYAGTHRILTQNMAMTAVLGLLFAKLVATVSA